MVAISLLRNPARPPACHISRAYVNELLDAPATKRKIENICGSSDIRASNNINRQSEPCVGGAMNYLGYRVLKGLINVGPKPERWCNNIAFEQNGSRGVRNCS